jgi:16S rRNA (guanine966-N2)-methyltransferase
MLKITAGKYKNRVISTVKSSNYRPSTSVVRQAIFNTLYSMDINIEGAYVLDAFCGTGSLGLEALSRNAKNITFIDVEFKNLDTIKKFAESLGEEENIITYQMDVTTLPNL